VIERQLEALGDIGTAKTTKEQKLAAICVFAQNKRGSQSATVAITPDEIRGFVGVSRRYAYDLIEEATTVLDGVRVREATDVQTSTGVEHKKKALLVDCEQVHTDGMGVNQFATGIAGGEAQAADEILQEGDHYRKRIFQPRKAVLEAGLAIRRYTRHDARRRCRKAGSAMRTA